MCTNISSLFIYFLAFDPNTTDFLHTWDQSNSIFHVLRCHLIDLMLLVVRCYREKEHTYIFFSFSLSVNVFFLAHISPKGNFIKSQGWEGVLVYTVS